jgi:hypothetical protein
MVLKFDFHIVTASVMNFKLFDTFVFVEILIFSFERSQTLVKTFARTNIFVPKCDKLVQT